MATLYPADLFVGTSGRKDGGLSRELDVIRLLDAALPSTYAIFHSVDWYSIHNGHDRQGEIDLIVMNQAGNLLLVEIKAGEVEECAEGLFKVYGAKRKDLSRQCRVQRAALQTRLFEAGLRPNVKHVLCLPDYRLLSGNSIAFPRECILDADDFRDLDGKLKQLLPEASSSALTERTRLFLLDTFRVAKSLDVLQGQLKNATYRLSDGLATWVPRIQSEQGVFRVQGSAGSGKTQLALTLLENAAKDSHRALYVCFNRALSDLVSLHAPTRSTVTTFHELAIDHYRRTIDEPDFTNPNIMADAANRYVEDSTGFDAVYDLMVIDEAQDFAPEWMQSVLPLLKDSGRLYLLEDTDQRLYKQEEFNIDAAVTLTCPDNFRSPRALVDTINALGLATRDVRPVGPYEGDAPEFQTYRNDEDMLGIIDRCISRYIRAGYALKDMAVLSYRGRDRSFLLKQTKLDHFTLRQYSGQFTPNGEPIWSDGHVLADTVYRYKGQSASVVILCEVDFESLGEPDRRKLYVALTRARMAATVVMTERAAAALAQILA